jgi:cobalt/nickel transport protein
VRSVPTRVLVAVGVLVALLLAGALSVHASREPDGLQRVADQHGLSDAAGEQRSAPGIMPDNPRLAAVAGTLLVLVLASGTTVLLRRRR